MQRWLEHPLGRHPRPEAAQRDADLIEPRQRQACRIAVVEHRHDLAFQQGEQGVGLQVIAMPLVGLVFE